MKKTKWSLLKFFNMKIKNQTEMIVDHRNTSIACVHVSPSEWYFVQSCLNFLKRKYPGFSTLFLPKKAVLTHEFDNLALFFPTTMKMSEKMCNSMKKWFFWYLDFWLPIFLWPEGSHTWWRLPLCCLLHSGGRVRTVHAPAHCYNDWPSLLG